MKFFPLKNFAISLFNRGMSPSPSSMIGLKFLFLLKSRMSSCILAMHLVRSMTFSSSCCSFRVLIVSSIALPKIVGRRFPIVSLCKGEGRESHNGQIEKRAAFDSIQLGKRKILQMIWSIFPSQLEQQEGQTKRERTQLNTH